MISMNIDERFKLLKSLGKDDLVKYLIAEKSINVDYWFSIIFNFVCFLVCIYQRSWVSIIFIGLIILNIYILSRDTKLLRSKFKRMI